MKTRVFVSDVMFRQSRATAAKDEKHQNHPGQEGLESSLA